MLEVSCQNFSKSGITKTETSHQSGVIAIQNINTGTADGDSGQKINCVVSVCRTGRESPWKQATRMV